MKRLISILLSVLLLCSCVVCASAATADLSETGKTIQPYDDWMLEMINNDSQYELDEYVGEGGEVIVPRIFNNMLIVQLGELCFDSNTAVTSVITSSPLWTIGEHCFINCTNLEKFECNYALKTIGIGAFSGTSSLKSINLEDSVVTKIEPHTFMNSGIEKIALPETCTELCHDCFAQCDSLTKIMIPDSVTTIHEDAFHLSENVVIYCNSASYAHEFAEAQGIPHVLIDVPVEVKFILGDADGDGVVTILDATMIQRVLAGLDEDEDGMISLRGASDGDALNIMHATKIQRYIASYPTVEPIGTEMTREIIPVF